MNRIIPKQGIYLTQTADLPIEERVFVKEVVGNNATDEFFRDATDEEVAMWVEYKSKIEKEMEVNI
jgi:hypothetical protein